MWKRNKKGKVDRMKFNNMFRAGSFWVLAVVFCFGITDVYGKMFEAKAAKISPDSLQKIITTNKFSSEIYLKSVFKSKIKDYTNAILIDADNGKILFEKDAYKMEEIASLTKMIVIQLILESIEDKKLLLTDTLIASRESSLIGGSQIYLREKEKMIVDDLFKSVVVKSANDATYLFAETLGKDGSVSDFIEQMNDKALELGMKNTVFYYPHGLPPSWADRKKKGIKGNKSTCYDLSLLAKELIYNHPKILEYSSIWLDSIRTSPEQKPFQLRNTSRLIKDYKYFDGLKTGFYDRAGFCVVATAKKEGRRLIAVVLGSRNQKKRNKFTNELVTWGFEQIEEIDIRKKAMQVINDLKMKELRDN